MRLYGLLSEWRERVHDALERDDRMLHSGPSHEAHVCLVILAEDLDALLEECAEILVCGDFAIPSSVSLRLRSQTVLEELQSLVSH